MEGIMDVNIYPELEATPLIVRSPYGTVKLKYTPKHENFWGMIVKGAWVAIMIDGEYKGKSESHHHHGWCVSHLLSACASMSAVKLVQDALAARGLA
jgi:hypothetical protein